MSKKVRRLFEQFQPENYRLDLAIDPDEMTFSGNVIINGKKVGRPSQRITFHQKNLKIAGAKITRHDKKGDIEVAISRINSQKSYDEVRLHSSQMIYPGEYTIELEFSGKITRNMEGIYPSIFAHAGKDKKIIATQFESHHAREAFPCIDEPEAKATFDLKLTTPKIQTVLANTPVKSSQVKSDKLTTSFESTPRMSTYLLAFAFGDIKYLEAKTKQGVVVRTYATPANVGHTQFALDCATKILDFYNDYFDIPYPLPKCDLVALPDFASGAMENWGLITFREQTLLVDDKNTSLEMKQYVATVVAHELAHQWFGNLVTMRWWTDLWLNEGFASWIEYLAVDHLFPEWQMWSQFLASEQSQALAQDALEHSHPIEVPIKHPDEIRTIFDAISYSKGSSVINMLKNYLGADTFRNGLRLYLKKNQYDNTDTVDLWAALEEVSGEHVKDFMHAWTTQTGFPLVTVKIEEDVVELKQKRFLLNRKVELNPSETWPIPLLTTANDRSLFVKSDKKFKLKDYDNFKLNLGQSGLYRVSYEDSHLQKLARQINKLEPVDRLGLISDAFETSKAGLASTVSALELLASYDQEDSPIVWDIIAGNLGSIRRVMDDEKLNDAMRPFVRKLVTRQLTRLGWQPAKNESHFDSLLRPTILGLSAWADEPATVKKALALFKKAGRPEDIAPDIRGIVYGTAARLGGAQEFDKMLVQHNASKSNEARLILTAALTGFKQAELVKKALAQIKSDNVRLQDAAYWVAYSLGNRYGKKLAWQWTRDNWDWLAKNLGDDLSFYRFPVYAARSFATSNFLKEYEGFFNDKKTPALERPINQGVETIEWQTAWRSRDHAALKKYFKA